MRRFAAPILAGLLAISAVPENVGSARSSSAVAATSFAGLPSSACIIDVGTLGSVSSPATFFATNSKRSLPLKSSRIFADAPLTVACPDVYPGNGGVTNVSGEYGCHSSAAMFRKPFPGPA